MTLPQLSSDAWQHDLSVFAAELTSRHKNPYHHTSKLEFDRALADLHAQIPSLPNDTVIVGLQQLAALIGDGHTRLKVTELYRKFPFTLFWFGRDLRILSTTEPYTRALGARVTKIGDRTVRDAHRRLQAIIPQAENKWYVLNASQNSLVYAEPLAALDIIPDPAHAPWTFETDAGERFTLDVASRPPDTLNWRDAVVDKPLYLQNPAASFYFSPVPDSNLLYANFRRYDNLAEHTAPYFEFLNAHHPETLVVDLRQNGGGDFTQGREHLIYPINFVPHTRSRRIYVITGRATFSAGMTNATDFRRETDAILIGEPTGARPIGFQETGSFTLPKSGLGVTCSILHYRFQDRNQSAVMPDIRIDPDWNSYRDGHDNVMDYLFSIV